ncbi:hypothetical protein X733_29510 [Mesorhizobium sp. L2C067A000]|nr:hypothetical protein X733_29510 [Mesorhizobium sp. L2C067A000]
MVGDVTSQGYHDHQDQGQGHVWKETSAHDWFAAASWSRAATMRIAIAIQFPIFREAHAA